MGNDRSDRDWRSRDLCQEGIPTGEPAPIDELDQGPIALGSHPRFVAIIEEARAQCRQGLGLSTEDVRRELGLN